MSTSADRGLNPSRCPYGGGSLVTTAYPGRASSFPLNQGSRLACAYSSTAADGAGKSLKNYNNCEWSTKKISRIKQKTTYSDNFNDIMTGLEESLFSANRVHKAKLWKMCYINLLGFKHLKKNDKKAEYYHFEPGIIKRKD